MGKKIKSGIQGGFPAWQILTGGFLLGVLLPNILWKVRWRQSGMASMYLLSTFAGSEVQGEELLLQVLRMRGAYFLLAVLCGISVFGAPLSILTLLLAGAEVGAILSMSVLQFGLAGGAVGIGLLFPQYLIYLPVLVALMRLVYQQSVDVWKNRGLFPLKVHKYAIRAASAGIFFLLGIAMEAYFNPLVVEMLTKNLIIFK